jgi:hypothetical protein
MSVLLAIGSYSAVWNIPYSYGTEGHITIIAKVHHRHYPVQAHFPVLESSSITL